MQHPSADQSSSCSPVLELGLLPRDCQRKVGAFVFTRLPETRTSRDMWSSSTANGNTRKETKKVIRKSSGATVGVASFGQTQLNTLDKRFVTIGIAITRTVDSFQRRLDSNVQSIMSRMVRELIWNKSSNHWRPKPGICMISINCPFMTRCQKKNYKKKSILHTDNDPDYNLHVTT